MARRHARRGVPVAGGRWAVARWTSACATCAPRRGTPCGRGCACRHTSCGPRGPPMIPDGKAPLPGAGLRVAGAREVGLRPRLLAVLAALGARLAAAVPVLALAGHDGLPSTRAPLRARRELACELRPHARAPGPHGSLACVRGCGETATSGDLLGGSHGQPLPTRPLPAGEVDGATDKRGGPESDPAPRHGGRRTEPKFPLHPGHVARTHRNQGVRRDGLRRAARVLP